MPRRRLKRDQEVLQCSTARKHMLATFPRVAAKVLERMSLAMPYKMNRNVVFGWGTLQSGWELWNWDRRPARIFSRTPYFYLLPEKRTWLPSTAANLFTAKTSWSPQCPVRAGTPSTSWPSPLGLILDSHHYMGHWWVEFVVGSHRCHEKFFSGCSMFPPSSTTQCWFPNNFQYFHPESVAN